MAQRVTYIFDHNLSGNKATTVFYASLKREMNGKSAYVNFWAKMPIKLSFKVENTNRT